MSVGSGKECRMGYKVDLSLIAQVRKLSNAFKLKFFRV